MKEKLYTIIAIIVSIILFSTATLCKQCGVKGEKTTFS